MNKQILLAIPMIFLASAMILPGSAKAYITQTSGAYAMIDADKKCDNYNTNATMSCFNLGVRGGFIDGTQCSVARFI